MPLQTVSFCFSNRAPKIFLSHRPRRKFLLSFIWRHIEKILSSFVESPFSATQRSLQAATYASLSNLIKQLQMATTDNDSELSPILSMPSGKGCRIDIMFDKFSVASPRNEKPLGFSRASFALTISSRRRKTLDLEIV